MNYFYSAISYYNNDPVLLMDVRNVSFKTSFVAGSSVTKDGTYQMSGWSTSALIPIYYE